MGIHLRQSCGGLVPGHWSSGGGSARSRLQPDPNLWLGTEDLLQAAEHHFHPSEKGIPLGSSEAPQQE